MINKALKYHSSPFPGKIKVLPSKRCDSIEDLSLAYTPGVAFPCREIEKDIYNSYKYTAKGNLVAVVTDGTAVLGMGDVGPEAAKPVMEGKSFLFSRFAGINAFDIELDCRSIEHLIDTIKAMEP